MNHPNERHDWDGIRAGNTIRWLDSSGPRYVPLNFVVVERLDADEFILRDPAGLEIYIGASNMSVASWNTLCQSADGDSVNILVRKDSVDRSGLEAVVKNEPA